MSGGVGDSWCGVCARRGGGRGGGQGRARAVPAAAGVGGTRRRWATGGGTAAAGPGRGGGPAGLAEAWGRCGPGRGVEAWPGAGREVGGGGRGLAPPPPRSRRRRGLCRGGGPRPGVWGGEAGCGPRRGGGEVVGRPVGTGRGAAPGGGEGAGRRRAGVEAPRPLDAEPRLLSAGAWGCRALRFPGSAVGGTLEGGGGSGPQVPAGAG